MKNIVIIVYYISALFPHTHTRARAPNHSPSLCSIVSIIYLCELNQESSVASTYFHDSIYFIYTALEILQKLIYLLPIRTNRLFSSVSIFDCYCKIAAKTNSTWKKKELNVSQTKLLLTFVHSFKCIHLV